MTSEPHPRLWAALREWANRLDAKLAITGSARQCRDAPSGGRRWITVEDLSKSTCLCLERASRDLWGRRAVRRGVRLLYAGALEGGEDRHGTRMHAHLILGGLPPNATFPMITQAIASRWRTSRWGYDDIDIQPLASPNDVDRWVDYLLKGITPATLDRWITNVPFH